MASKRTYRIAEFGWVKGSEIESERRQKKHRFDDDGKSSDKYLQMFQNEVRIRVEEELLGPTARGSNCAGEMRLSIL